MKMPGTQNLGNVVRFWRGVVDDRVYPGVEVEAAAAPLVGLLDEGWFAGGRWWRGWLHGNPTFNRPTDSKCTFRGSTPASDWCGCVAQFARARSAYPSETKKNQETHKNCGVLANYLGFPFSVRPSVRSRLQACRPGHAKVYPQHHVFLWFYQNSRALISIYVWETIEF